MTIKGITILQGARLGAIVSKDKAYMDQLAAMCMVYAVMCYTRLSYT